METLKTEDGSITIVHPEHGEAYHSRLGAVSESFALYVEASGFAELLRNENDPQPVSICDVGLGLGYNALATIEGWMKDGRFHDLNILSLEIDRDLFLSFSSGIAAWQSDWSDEWVSWSSDFIEKSDATFVKEMTNAFGRKLQWTVWIGDAAQDKTLSQQLSHHNAFNFVWQDPFSPTKNPTMWSKEWFTIVKDHAKPEAKLMTYSVARYVKTSLEESGWAWEKIPTIYKSKRSWLKATPSTI